MLAQVITDTAIPLTNRLSASWLAAAARGEAGQPWHTLVDALASGNEPRLKTTIKEIIAVGHTSGADALAGFICALQQL